MPRRGNTRRAPACAMMEAFTNQPLPVGGMIQEFRILRVLGAGSFGIVYHCENTFLPEEAAIKEFLPMDVAGRLPNGEVRPLSDAAEEGFLWARDRFLQEAKTLWNLGHPNPHRNIVRVTRFCEANGTAYMFMAFERGRPLSALLEERDTLPYAELKQIIFPPSRPSTRPAPWTPQPPAIRRRCSPRG